MENNSHAVKSEQKIPSVDGKLQKVWSRFTVPSKNELKNYGEETSLHGLKYVFQSERHLHERIFWTISFVSGIVMAVFLIYGVCTSYLKNPVIVTYQVEETRISGIPFPAVTLCNTNRVRKSVATELIKSAKNSAGLGLDPCCSGDSDLEHKNVSLKTHLKNLKCIDYICQVPELFGSSEESAQNPSLYDMLLEEKDNKNDDLLVPVNIEEKDVGDIREAAAHSCDEIALHCRWANKEYNCSEFFSILLTDEGYCCAFNKIPATAVADLNNMFENAANKAAWGTDSSRLESAIGKTKYDSSYRIWLENIAKIRTQQRSGRIEGLSIVLNPQLEEYYCSAFNGPGFVFKTHLPLDTPLISEHSTPIPPKTEVFVSIIPEAIFADTDIKWFSPEKRRCYFEGEYKLDVFKTYTQENCLTECEGALLEELCGCRMYSINLIKNNTCGPNDHVCVRTVFEPMKSKLASEICSECFPTCNDLRYNQNVVTSPISEKNSKFHTGQSREFYSDWVTKGASILHVYFEHDAFYARERKELSSWKDLVGSIGGLLGLCLGFSGLSLIEMIYFFSIRPCFKRRGKDSLEHVKESDEGSSSI